MIEILQNVVQGGLLTAPPRRHSRQRELFPEEALGDSGKKAQPRRRFKYAASQCIREHDAPGAHGADQAGHPEGRVASQLDRIAVVVVEAAQNRVHPLQAGECLQVYGVAANGEIRPLDEGDAELTRQVNVLEIRLVEGAGREDHRKRAGTAIGLTQQARAQLAEKSGNAADAQVADRLRQHLLDDFAIFEGISGTGGRLRAVREQPPFAIRSTREIGRIEVQPTAAGRGKTVTGPQKVGMAESQLGRDDSFGKQSLSAVEVGQQGVQCPGALRDTCLDDTPFLRTDHEGKRIERPGAIRALRIGVHVIADAVLDDQATGELDAAPRRIARVPGSEAVDESPPVRSDGSGGVEQLVVPACVRDVAGKRGVQYFPVHFILRSSVNGCSGPGDSSVAAMVPGVWPIRKKRASRRLSDSNEFTGKALWLRPPGCMTWY